MDTLDFMLADGAMDEHAPGLLATRILVNGRDIVAGFEGGRHMKLIFLDIDGVLNRDSTRIAAPSGCMFVEDELVERLRRIYCRTHARIVLSSSWRMGWYELASGRMDTPNAMDYQALSEKLLSSGIPINGHTEILPDRSRAGEIARYVAREPDVEAFVILDDMAIRGLETHQVRTNPELGLTEDDVEKAIEILRGRG